MHEFFFHLIFPCANILFRTSLPISDKFSNGQSFSELKLTMLLGLTVNFSKMAHCNWLKALSLSNDCQTAFPVPQRGSHKINRLLALLFRSVL